jgi:hypothetical protein
MIGYLLIRGKERRLAADARRIGNVATEKKWPGSSRKRSIVMTQTVSKISQGDGDREEFQMSPLRKTAFVAGVLYLLTFVSIPTLFLYSPVKGAGYILGSGPDTAVIVGSILEIIVALAGVGTAIVLFPVLKRQNEGVALGFVGSRVLEAATIFAGVVFLLSVVSLRQAGVGSAGLVLAQALVAMYNRTFLVGQSLMPAVNALLLGSLLYEGRLVVWELPLLGFSGAALLVAADIGVLFNLWEQTSLVTVLAALPIALWEFLLGVYLVVKGFQTAGVSERIVAVE